MIPYGVIDFDKIVSYQLKALQQNSADNLTPNGTRASADRIPTGTLDILSSKFFVYQWRMQFHFADLAKFRGAWSIKKVHVHIKSQVLFSHHQHRHFDYHHQHFHPPLISRLPTINTTHTRPGDDVSLYLPTTARYKCMRDQHHLLRHSFSYDTHALIITWQHQRILNVIIVSIIITIIVGVVAHVSLVV